MRCRAARGGGRMTGRPPSGRGRRARPLVPVMRTEPLRPPDPPVDYFIRDKWAFPVNPVAVGMDWGRRGFSCDRIIDPPGQEWRDVEHESAELIVVLDGRLEVEVRIDGVTRHYDAMAGDELFVPAGAPHTVRNAHTGNTRWLYGYQSRLLDI